MNKVPHALALALLLSTCARPAYAQEFHEHGVDGLPDWYASDCCSLNDCRPVADNEIDYGLDMLGNPVVLHKPTGLVFERSRWRVSQDERLHVCYRGTSVFTPFCVYLRGGA